MGSQAVSILARPSRAGRLGLALVMHRRGSPTFQSSLGPRGPGVGGLPSPSLSTQISIGFNPRSALAGRASLECLRPRHPRQGVSILARPSRAGRPSLAPPVFAPSSTVSILARPSRAGRLAGIFRRASGDRPGVSILARPSRAGRPYSLRTTGSRCNPRSALAGRASAWSATPPARSCFNPRSALAGRASRHDDDQPGNRRVSILARPSRAGRQSISAWPLRLSSFQSSLGPRGPGVR
jgi:hypothetical protein